MKDFGPALAQIRAERNHTQESLAKELGITKQTISNYESGKRRPKYEMLEAICDTLNVPIEFFMTREEQEAELGEIYKKYKNVAPSEQTEMLYVSFAKGDGKADSLRKQLHQMIDTMSDDDLRLLKDITIRIGRGGGHYME